MKFIEDVVITKNENIVEDIYVMEFISKNIAKTSYPGQFLQVKVNEFNEPILRRPISINEIKKEEDKVVIYYKVIGKGTKAMANLKVKDQMNVLGPIGTGFDTDYKNKNIAIVGGGIGIAPLLELAKALKDNNIYTYLGYNDNPYLNREIDKYSKKNIISTTTGREGYKGFVTDLFEKDIEKIDFDIIFTCGPKPMIKKVMDLAKKHNVKCQVSLEERMACGIGACLGCSIEIADGSMKKVCVDGPVFWSNEVIIDD
ncbi:dihydroorotate dehydrogenase electron transfer subunit [Dethiothermospora halolimnae]|uniref:dihydroorotate dehydrogenase electron transfer subunit n=1 Tax=Dethiothermospora halolimnae TaxID=3114390 RepID=UPI003CCB8741